MKLDGLDDKNTNTDDIIKVYKHVFTKYVDKEPGELESAIKEIEEFLAEPTPKYKEGKEPIHDKETGKLLFPGEEETTLIQFLPENKIEFSEKARVIDKAMKVIPYVIMDIRNQLNNYKLNGTPLNLPISPPEEKKQPGILERLGFKQPQQEPSSEVDEYVKSLITHILQIREKWSIWSEWYYGSIKYPENRGTWSDIYSRKGMERLLTRLQEAFDYWIVKRFIPIHQYAMDMHLTKLTEDTNQFVKALARMQHESETQSSFT